jgi:molybdenum cofactor cytidylyltransferase
MTDPYDIVAIILAAGQGSRFREVAGLEADKLLATCPGLDGVQRPVLGHVLKSLEGRVARKLLITRPASTDIIALADGCEVILLDSPGIGDSIAAAVKASPNAAGWLILLGDMPFIQPATLDSLLAAMGPDQITVPVSSEGYGHPVGFGAAFAQPLQVLRGDQGARKLFQGQRLVEVPVPDAGIYQDVDVPSSLNRPIQAPISSPAPSRKR